MSKRRSIRITFSQQLIITYSAIILIPLLLLVIFTSLYMQEQQVTALIELGEKELTENANRVQDDMESFARLTSVLSIKNEFLHLISSEDTDWNNFDTIDELKRALTEIERNIFLLPSLENVHIYNETQHTPERWPILFSEDRMDKTTGYPWDFAVQLPFRLTQSGQENPYVVSQMMELTLLGKHIGYLQTTTKLSNFLPELYELANGEQENFVYYNDPTAGIQRITAPDAPFSTEVDAISENLQRQAIEKILASADSAGVITLKEKMHTYTVVYRKLENPELLLLQVCPTQDIERAIRRYRVGGVLAAFLLMGTVFLAIYYATKKRTDTLNKIMQAMGEVSKGNFDIQAPQSTGVGEVAEATKAFETLTRQLRESIEMIKKEQELLADTEIKAMQSQINAHFIFNALESIKMLAVLHNDDEIEESTSLLGYMIRYCLKWKVKMVSVADELEYCDTYVELMNFRNDYQVELRNEIDPSLYQQEIPKMLVQPIIENAFHHSFGLTGKDGTITIRSRENDTRFFLVIQNDGIPIDDEKIAEITTYLKHEVPEKEQKQGHIGLKNIQERLFIFYGEDYRIEIGRDENGYTTICIPIKRM